MDKFMSKGLLRKCTGPAISIAACLAMLGCAASNSVKNQSAIALRRASVFKDGPAQGRPADFEVPAGQTVQVRNRALGYSLIETPDGLTGYVLSDSLQIQSALIAQNTKTGHIGPHVDGSVFTPLPSSTSSRESKTDPTLFDPQDFGAAGIDLPKSPVQFRTQPRTRD